MNAPSLAPDRQQAEPAVSPRPIASLPALSPTLLLRTPTAARAFPFGDSRTRFFYLGRGAVWHAVRLLGLTNEEILVPAYHHGVEVEALVEAGVRLRFYNVERSFRADLADIVARITPQTRAIYVTHFVGFPQPMDELLSIARTRGLKLIEDCALALFSCDGHKPLGSRGDAAIFNLYKSLPLPHGGALWMPGGYDGTPLESAGWVPTLHQVASSMLLRFEREAGSWGQHAGRLVRRGARLARSVRPLPVDARPVGHRTFRRGQEMIDASPLAVALAARIDPRDVVAQRRRNYYALLSRLRDVSAPMVQELGHGVSPLFYPLWVPHKRRVQERLAREGIDAIDFWSEGSPLVTPGEFPDVDALRAHVLELPIHQDLDTDDMNAIASAVRRAIGA